MCNGNNQFRVYRFLDYRGNIIYIGKTKNLNQRIYHHFSYGHLPKECYDQVVAVEYIEMVSKGEMDMYEIYLINNVLPYFNTRDKREDTFTFQLPEKRWKRFDRLRHDKPIEEPPINMEDELEILQNKLYEAESEIKRTRVRIRDFYIKNLERTILENKDIDTSTKQRMKENIDYIRLELNYLKHYGNKEKQDQIREEYLSNRSA